MHRFKLWVDTFLFIFGITFYLSIVKRRRLAHHHGLIGSGWIPIVDDPAFPENDFLRPGHKFP